MAATGETLQAQTSLPTTPSNTPPPPSIGPETEIHRILDGRVHGKDAVDALDIAIAATRTGSRTVFSTEILTKLVEGVATARNPRRTNRDVAHGMGTVCGILGGRLSGTEKSLMWRKVLNGGFPDASSAFL